MGQQYKLYFRQYLTTWLTTLKKLDWCIEYPSHLCAPGSRYKEGDRRMMILQHNDPKSDSNRKGVGS
jgi:hypothetical protein